MSAKYKIEVNTELEVLTSQGAGVSVLGSGNFGGGQMTLGYKNEYGNFIAFLDGGPFTANFDKVVECGVGLTVIAKLVSATTPTISLIANHRT